MTFQEQLFSVFLGSILAFFFGILLFLITYWLVNKNLKKSYRKLLKREFEFNISLLENWLNDFTDVIVKISNDDHNVYHYFKYADFQVYFLRKAFELGIIYDSLKKDEDISKLIGMLNFFSSSNEHFVNQQIKSWKNNEIEKRIITDDMQFNKSKINEYLKFLKDFSKDLNL